MELLRKSRFNSFLRRNWRSGYIIIALCIDTSAIIISGLSAFYLRNFIPNLPILTLRLFVSFTLYFWFVLLFSGLVLGLYRAAFHSNERQQYILAGKALFYSMLFIFASFYLLQLEVVPRRFTFIFFALLPLIFSIGRGILNSINLKMQGRGFGIHRALIAGYENGGIEIFQRFKGFPELGYEIMGVVYKNKLHNGAPQPLNIAEESNIPSYSISQLTSIIREQNIDKMFIPSPKFVTNGYSELMDVCMRENIELKVLSPESDQLLRMARVYDIAGITLFSQTRSNIESFRKFSKRAFDFLFASLLLIILSPIFLITSLAILLESGRPIIFKQKRSSTRNGKEFYFYKFRSMIHNADEMKESLFQFNETNGALFKMKNDPRMTKVGKIIRKFSIDELPQLFNVLKGDMSLVGPRPLPVTDFEKLSEDPEFWEAIKGREKLKAGITGLWQISGRSNIGFREMVLLDLYYIENQSFLFDLEIMFETIPVVVFGKGSY